MLIDSGVRSRGRSYYHQGLVRIKQGDKKTVEATVRGTSSYKVTLRIDGNDCFVSCTCPYYDGGDTCKHIWATMLAAEARGYLYGAEPTRLRLADSDDDYDDDDDDDDDDDAPYQTPARYGAARPPTPAGATKLKPVPWKQQFATVSQAMKPAANRYHEDWSHGRELFYVVDMMTTLTGGGLTVEVVYRERKNNGEWGKLKSQGLIINAVPYLPDADDRQIVGLLLGARNQSSSYSPYDSGAHRFQLFHPIEQTLMPMMCRTGRCRLRRAPDAELSELRWDDRGAWQFWLDVRRGAASNQYVIRGSLRRDGVRRELAEPVLLTDGGLVFDDTLVAPLDDGGAFAWISMLRKQGALYVPLAQADQLLEEMFKLPTLPRLDLPDELHYEEAITPPRPRLKVREPERTSYWGARNLRGEVSFDYDGEIVPDEDARRGIFRANERRVILRDTAMEQEAIEHLKRLGFRRGYAYGQATAPLELAPNNLPRAVRLLVSEGWHIEAEGKLYRQPGEFKIEVTSGIDWFELHGGVDFGGTAASLPELLAALKRGESVVKLGDGTFGLLPEDWLKKYGLLAGLGQTEDDHLRFSRSQLGLLDALLASQPEASFDATFALARDELRTFAGIEALEPPTGFTGELRGYQKDGLGWFQFLQRFGFGGCLADDMGLGKTIQTLALLEARREMRANGDEQNATITTPKKKSRAARKADNQHNGNARRLPPSLVVVPKSLVFNWKQEAARFTPRLRVLDHTGQFRGKTTEHFEDYDLVITTYGTLRRDAVQFKGTEFDYLILDEAQAIKNADTASSKAARLLRGRHRLALSGTPVENHLGELWAMFDFLNPGLLGAATVFNLTGLGARNPDEETRVLLSRALRPFILRRTKEQVAKDLPPKLEQTIYCEMEPVQRKLYDDLRDHYRAILLGLVDERGLKRSKMQILEALLRLRQASCHPGLIDKQRSSEPSAKLEMLLPQLQEVMAEGHKALVFSQFTSLLAIVRDRLDKAGVVYEYLDGRTRDRAARVERFQTDADCKLFLVSLKAGGLGLNLTAAEYVFLLDPWWNPAVEAQAIDRAHRIGQTRNVFAYRLIARGTVEEKVLELQQTKRELADAIINADNSLIRTLGRDDLELLLS